MLLVSCPPFCGQEFGRFFQFRCSFLMHASFSFMHACTSIDFMHECTSVAPALLKSASLSRIDALWSAGTEDRHAVVIAGDCGCLWCKKRGGSCFLKKKSKNKPHHPGFWVGVVVDCPVNSGPQLAFCVLVCRLRCVGRSSSGQGRHSRLILWQCPRRGTPSARYQQMRTCWGV